MKKDKGNINNTTNGKHIPRKGMSTTGYWPTIKKQTISKKIIESKNNMKQLFQFVNNLTISKTPNPMPEGKTDAQLAEEFASFFLDKIEKNQTLIPKHQ